MSTETRKAVRADSDLPPGARLLFEEIWEMHHDCEKGCYASNEELGSRVGAAASSVRRYRRKLRNAGHLKEEKTGGRIYKIPAEAANSDREPVSTDQNDQNQGVSTDHSGQNCTQEAVSSDQDMSSYNPEGTREGAPAHEDSHDDTPEEVFTSLASIWRSVSNAPPMTEKIEDVLWGWAHDEKIPDQDLFRDVLEEQAANTTSKGCGLSPGILLREYRDQLQSGKLEPWQAESDDWSVNEQGKVCFKGVPVEETGPQNLAADLQGAKDGAPSEPPEVSA
jgi:hypothetical protein